MCVLIGVSAAAAVTESPPKGTDIRNGRLLVAQLVLLVVMVSELTCCSAMTRLPVEGWVAMATTTGAAVDDLDADVNEDENGDEVIDVNDDVNADEDEDENKDVDEDEDEDEDGNEDENEDGEECSESSRCRVCSQLDSSRSSSLTLAALLAVLAWPARPDSRGDNAVAGEHVTRALLRLPLLLLCTTVNWPSPNAITATGCETRGPKLASAGRVCSSWKTPEDKLSHTLIVPFWPAVTIVAREDTGRTCTTAVPSW
mmetsp:Transcript_32367/g.63300  ORF Transcript_32367/g.63300 Transcript_32367/m.63300 type:complete len:257 (-) Transcript_32367:230-1000(-)